MCGSRTVNLGFSVRLTLGVDQCRTPLGRGRATRALKRCCGAARRCALGDSRLVWPPTQPIVQKTSARPRFRAIANPDEVERRKSRRDALEYDVFVEMGQGRFGAEPARASRAPDQGGIIAVHSASGRNFTRQEIRRPCPPRDDCIDSTHGRGGRTGWRPWPPRAGSFGRRSVSGPEASSPLQGVGRAGSRS